MHKLFSRWFNGSRSDESWVAAEAWAVDQGWRFARSKDGSGFVIEPVDAAAPRDAWRLEWGSSQRHYIAGSELRLRAEVGTGNDLQMLLASRRLATVLEHQVFEEITDGTQTRMDDDTPEEMRWLVLYAKVPRIELGALREHFVALSNLPRAALLWLDEPLRHELESCCNSWMADGEPLVMVVQRGRLTLRCAVARPDVATLQAAMRLFRAALPAARKVGEEVARGAVGRDRPSSWGAPSAMPEIDHDAR